MRTGAERRESFFDPWKQAPDRLPVLFPRKVDADTRLLITWTHPKTVSGNGAHLANLQERSHLLAHLRDGVDCRKYVLAGNEILALQFLAAAGHVIHAEMRQPFMPRAGNT